MKVSEINTRPDDAPRNEDCQEQEEGLGVGVAVCSRNQLRRYMQHCYLVAEFHGDI